MYYQLKNLTPPQIARLDEVPIAKQEQIIEKTGEPLKLLTAFYLVKNASADFTVQHEAAEKLDASMYTLLVGKGFFDGTMKTAAKPEPAQSKPAAAALPKEKKAPDPAPSFKPATVEKPSKPKVFSISNYPLAKKFMPVHQQQAVKSFGEEREAIFEEVEKMLAGIPKLRSQAKKELMEKTVYAHYFYGQSDWFILEYSASDDLFYGYVILNGDSQMSESGYIGRRDLTESNRIELDFYWKPTTLGEALHKADPEFFPAPKSNEQPATAELISIGLGAEGRGTLQSWGKALPVMEWLRINTPFLFPKEPTKENPATFRIAEGATIELLASLYDNKIRVFAPKFKKGDSALYKGKPVVIKNDGAFDTIARDWIYLTKGSDWDESDNVGENHLSIATMLPDWSGFTAADETSEVVESQAKSKRLRLAQAKAKAQAARIRILKLKSQKAA